MNVFWTWSKTRKCCFTSCPPACFIFFALVNLKFVICLKSKAKQNNQLKFIFPMLFCISYKFLACFSNIILMSLDSLEWTEFIVHAKNLVIYISESMFNDGHVCFLITGASFLFKIALVSKTQNKHQNSGTDFAC